MGKLCDLPNELLRSLFLLLPLEDRKLVVLVSRRWRWVGEDPLLWKCCIVSINRGNDISKLSLRRFHYVQEIIVSTWSKLSSKQLEELFQASLELPKLKEMDVRLDVRGVNSELLARALVRLEELTLIGNRRTHSWGPRNGRTTNDQRVAIFKKLPDNGCVKKLSLSRINLSALELEAEILGKVVSGLQELSVCGVDFTNDQVGQIFKSISENSTLNTINFYSQNVSSVEPVMFGKAMAKIEDVSLDRMDISAHQATALFTEMGQDGADPKIFARGLSKLEKVGLSTNDLTRDQVRALFTELNKNCKLKFLDLGYNDLSSVSPDDLAEVITNIEVVDVSDTNLNEEQKIAVLTRAQQSTKLKRLNIRGLHISQEVYALVTTMREKIAALDIDTEFEDEESDEDDSHNGFTASENGTDGESDIGLDG